MGKMVYLASKSPRRGELLDQLGVDYHLLDVDVDEAPLAGELPGQYVTRLAVAKAEAGWVLSQKRDALPVVGADTCIAIDNMILGKPKAADHGFDMLESLSGRTHDVYCAVSIVGTNEQQTGTVKILMALNNSQVTFREIADDEIRDYWRTGEPQGKAGGYAIQGMAARFIYPSRIGFPSKACVIFVFWQGAMTSNSRPIARNRNAARKQIGCAICRETCP